MANLYYYTSAKHAISNIELKRIKISLFSDLNDPYELLGINRVDSNIRKELRDQKKQIARVKGLICLSKDCDNILMWGHYANRHKGIVLGFEVNDSLCNKVNYKHTLINMPKKSPHDSINDLMVTKSHHWEYEKEVRVFQELSGTECIKEKGIYFRKFNEDLILKEVIFGLNCSAANRKKTLTIINELNIEVEITALRIAFQRYGVVVNKEKTNLLKKKLQKSVL